MSVPIYRRIDYSGRVCDLNQYEQFDDRVIAELRETDLAESEKFLLIVDKGFGLEVAVPHLVIDHLNLTGANPLLGPNHPIGERFPVVNDVYLTNESPRHRKGVAAGLKEGIVPSAEEMGLLKRLGADFYCYNLVPTVLVAAHAGWRVWAMIVPPGQAMASEELFEDFSLALKKTC